MKMIRKENKYFIFDREKNICLKSFCKYIYFVFLSFFYKIFLYVFRPRFIPKKYNVSVCAIFKNEAPYLREWIEYNHLIGIDHFFLYNNNSNDDFLLVLKPYIKKGLVTLVDWPFNKKQMECYIDCIQKYSDETKWLGFIDLDEFIVPKSTNSIYDFLKKFEKTRSAVKIYWRLFGTSGKLDRQSGLVVEDFIVCWDKYCDIGKCFYNTAYSFNSNSFHKNNLHHSFWACLKGIDIPPVNCFDHICIGDRNVADLCDFPIQINHYFTKSYIEYAQKKSKGDVYFLNNPHDEKYFFEHEMKCISVDYSAFKYLIKLKKLMLDKDNNNQH